MSKLLDWIKRMISPEEEESIKLDEVSDWLDRRGCTEELSKNAEQLYGQIKNSLEDLKKSLDALEKAEIREEVFPKLLKAGISNRENMVRHIKILLNQIEVPDKTDYQTVLDFYDSAVSSLRYNTEQSLRSHYYVKLLFEKEANDVISKVKTLEGLVLKVKELITGEMKLVRKAKEKLAEIRREEERGEEEKRRITELSGKIDQLRTRLKEKENEFAELRKSSRWTEEEHREREKREIEKSILEVERQTIDLLSPLTKVFNRLKKLAESGRYFLSPDEKKILEYSVLDIETEKVEKFLKKIEELLTDGTVSVKEKNREKILKELKIILKDDLLREYRKRYLELKRKEKGIRTGENVKKEGRELKRNIDEIRGEIKTSEKTLENLKDHRKRNRIDEKKKELEKLLEKIAEHEVHLR